MRAVRRALAGVHGVEVEILEGVEAAGSAGDVVVATPDLDRADRIIVSGRRIPALPLPAIQVLLDGHMVGTKTPSLAGPARHAGALPVCPKVPRAAITVSADSIRHRLAAPRASALRRCSCGLGVIPSGVQIPEAPPKPGARRFGVRPRSGIPQATVSSATIAWFCP